MKKQMSVKKRTQFHKKLVFVVCFVLRIVTMMKKFFTSGSLHDELEIAMNIKSIKSEKTKIVRPKFSIPLNIVCGMMEYTSSYFVYCNFLVLSKRVFNILTIEETDYSKNILFRLERKVNFVKSYKNVFKLRIKFIEGFDERCFVHFPNLEVLKVKWVKTVLYFSDVVFKYIPKIKQFSSVNCCAISGKDFKRVNSTLVKLKVSLNNKLEDKYFDDIPNLRELSLWNCPKITGRVFHKLKNLEVVKLGYLKEGFNFSLLSSLKLRQLVIEKSYSNFKDDFFDGEIRRYIEKLTLWSFFNPVNWNNIEELELKELEISNNKDLEDSCYYCSRKLEKLTIWNNKKMFGKHFPRIKDLRELKIFENGSKFRDKIFKYLPNLELIYIFRCRGIKGDLLSSLLKLKKLSIKESNSIVPSKLEGVKAEKLFIRGCKNFNMHSVNILKTKLSNLVELKYEPFGKKKKSGSMLSLKFPLASKDKGKNGRNEYNTIVKEFRKWS